MSRTHRRSPPSARGADSSAPPQRRRCPTDSERDRPRPDTPLTCDALIAQAVGAVVRRLDEDDLLAGLLVLRYWEGGPHVRLRLRPTGRTAAVEALTTTTLRNHLAAHPAQGTWDPIRYASAAERFAAAGGMSDHDRRLHPYGRVARRSLAQRRGPTTSATGRRGPEPEMRQPHTIDFHEILLGTGRYKTEVLSSSWFLGHRLAINMLYAHLARVGLAPLQRYLFCHLLAAAVEDEYNVSPVARAQAWAQHS
ncbi:lantibiotic dehydratase C-terminal domain-containing protein [Actinomadura harenae]|uniref:Thiopeptide-type bacteriocin biosynthesis domain-containing protein n=1 Tax=Actinomadura harenae TaxID=2483351 RepID=A0A3M2M3B6_9ACTN|nr:lantibiotic dehydratase C-terminal domain-containing protein [Actinomadura harenae]RMI44046.1 hypothetical protein EBO15_14075 [Actinomadura harenae]